METLIGSPRISNWRELPVKVIDYLDTVLEGEDFASEWRNEFTHFEHSPYRPVDYVWFKRLTFIELDGQAIETMYELRKLERRTNDT